MELRSDSGTIRIDDRTGALVSFRAAHAPEHEFLVAEHGALPTFVVQYLDDRQRLRQLTSLDAQAVAVTSTSDGRSVQILYDRVGSLNLQVVATISVVEGDPAIYWGLSLTLPAPARVVNVQYPFIVVSYAPAGDPNATKLLRPFGQGQLYQKLRPHHFPPDFPDTWQLLPGNGDSSHYPGLTFAQFLAYYDDRAGLLVSCRDSAGHVKLIQPAHHDPGLRLGIAHVVGWDTPGQHRLPYVVALQGFRGDWWDAAEIYRQWSLQQPWARTPLADRRDVPAWVTDLPLYTVMRIQGELDAAPTRTHPEFTPYENALPLLDHVAERANSPLAPIIMAWERPGPWVYPDCFPPTGGEESLRTFIEQARQRGWHVGTYCNGTRWSIAHKWSGYQGDQFFRDNGGPESICRLPDGQPWASLWDQRWRPSYTGCIGAERTRALLRDYAQTLLGYGLDWIQILDQNVGCSTFPCYATNHDHPPLPGRWMTEHMVTLLSEIRELGVQTGRDVVWSVEAPCCEYFLQAFAICDVRPDARTNFVPLYHYLYHDYILTQSTFGKAPNPYFLVLKFARAFVLGEALGCCLGTGGRLQNWEPPAGEPWIEWDQPAGDQDAAYALLRNAVALRRGIGKDFLVFGRLRRPVGVTDVHRIAWTHGGAANDVAAVESATWEASDGRIAVALANWTGDEQRVRVDLRAYGGTRGVFSVASEDKVVDQVVATGGFAELRLAPLACGLLTVNVAEKQDLPAKELR